MQPILVILSMLALSTSNARVAKTNTGALFQKRATSLASRGKQSEVAGIEAYAKSIERYVKSHPRLTRYYVDALPEGKADSSPAGKKDWYRIKNEREMLDAEREYATRSAAVSTKDGEIVYASIGEPMEHSSHDTGYYFRADGTLAKISSGYYSNIEEIRIVRESFYDTEGKLLRSTARCFNIITTSRGSKERPASCKKSEMREELGNYKLSVFAKNTDLPGYDILKTVMSNK
ncbi:MAG TPA: hypothetical protein VF779_16155 [Pyrinomonadaceae bacterium]